MVNKKTENALSDTDEAFSYYAQSHARKYAAKAGNLSDRSFSFLCMRRTAGRERNVLFYG